MSSRILETVSLLLIKYLIETLKYRLGTELINILTLKILYNLALTVPWKRPGGVLIDQGYNIIETIIYLAWNGRGRGKEKGRDKKLNFGCGAVRSN